MKSFNKKITIPTTKTLVLLCALWASMPLVAAPVKDFDAVLASLKKKSPACNAEINNHAQNITKTLDNFLDEKNNESYAQHLTKIHDTISNFITWLEKHPGTNKISAAKNLRINLRNFLAALKSLGDKPYLYQLGGKLQQYSYLLPKEIRDKNNNTTIVARKINHRLSCS